MAQWMQASRHIVERIVVVHYSNDSLVAELVAEATLPVFRGWFGKKRSV